MILFIVYIVILMTIGFLSGLLKIDADEWILLAVLWPFIVSWLILQAIALIAYLIGEKIKNGDY